jgi:hypothetical protein
MGMLDVRMKISPFPQEIFAADYADDADCFSFPRKSAKSVAENLHV